MLGRLFSLLLLFALITPALAMSGHCASPMTMPERAGDMHMASTVSHREQHHESRDTERRDCVGCVLPGLGDVLAIESPVASALAGTASHVAPVPFADGQPNTPPPRA